MRNRTMLIVGATIAVIALTAIPTVAQEEQVADTEATAQAQETQTVTGTVKAVDEANQQLVLVAETDEEMSFTFTRDTVVAGLGDDARVADLQNVDAKVKVTYIEQGGEAWITKIEPQPSGDSDES